MLKVLREINGSFCSALPVFHPQCSLPSLHRVFTVLCAGVRSSSYHLLTCKNSTETIKTYQPLFIPYKEEKTHYYNVLKFLSITFEIFLWKKESINKMQTQINKHHYDAGTLGIENLYFLSAILILFHL